MARRSPLEDESAFRNGGAAVREKPTVPRAGRGWEGSDRPTAPAWFVWAPAVAIGWALAYGTVQALWAAGGPPSLGPLETDLLVFSGWAAVGLCAAAAGVALALITAPWRRWLLVAAWGLVAALAAACALLLLDVVGVLLPGVGVEVYPAGMGSRAACLAEAGLMGTAAVAYRRRWRAACLYCGRSGAVVPRPTQPPWWGWCAAYLAVIGCLVRLAAQVAVGFGGVMLESVPALVFEAGFVLAGTVLPLALVHSWGRVVPSWIPRLAGRRMPRWLPLGPAFVIGGGMTAYFGASIVLLAAQMLTGSWDQGGDDLPLAFFWVAMSAYEVWGVGLVVAALAYYRMTRPLCRACGM